MDIPEDSSKMGLKVGEEIPFIEVLYGTMILSGKDGAKVIEETVSGTIPAFVDLMNYYISTILGCVNTHFVNAHGYQDDNHYTNAYDMGLITLEAMKNETFRANSKTITYTINRTNLQKSKIPVHHHKI